jgi:minor extracellular serine protease Vpr
VCENCDEAAVTFDVPAFKYFGQMSTRLTMTTNGYLIVGDDTTILFLNQHLPNPSLPNNVIAPYWTDLDLDGDAPDDPGAGTWSAAVLTNSTTGASYFVAEWAGAAEFSVDGSAHSFQVWIKLGTDQIFMTYGPNTVTPPKLTVGAENLDGSVGDNYYFSDGSAPPIGTPPAAGNELAVQSPFTPTTHMIRFNATGVRRGTYVNTAELTSSLFTGANLASATVRVVRP